MKKLILSILLIMLIMTGCDKTAEDELEPAEENQEVNWQTALEKFLTVTAPVRARFYDLDDNGIPEAVILFGPPQSEPIYVIIYKLYGDSYEEIGALGGRFIAFYTNAQGKLVLASEVNNRAASIYFAGIKDNKLVLSDFIDSDGNGSYLGVKYDNLLELEDMEIDIRSAADLDESLQPLPEIDCSDIISAAGIRLYVYD